MLTVQAASEGQRLDNFLLRHLKGVPRSLVYRLVRKGAIRVNGRRAKAEMRVTGGDEVRIPVLDRPGVTPEGARTVHVPEGMLRALRQSVIHEDADYLVLDKPAGVAVHGGSGLAYGLIEAMRLLYPATALELGHRLDRETSGCLVLTKSRRGLTAFHDALRRGDVSKRYLALVAGRWEGPARRCDLPISQERDETGRRQIRALEGLAIEGSEAESARRATSLFAPIERFPGFTLMEVDIGTGRTHQIRVHGRALGHPVVGDHEYGDPGANRLARGLGLKRMFLHAQAIRFPDWQGDSLLFSAPLPADLEQVLQALSDQAP